MVINGHKSVVFGVGQANYIIVSARTSGDEYNDGISLFCIKSDVNGLNIQDYQTVDGFRAGEVILNNVEVPKENLIV